MMKVPAVFGKSSLGDSPASREWGSNHRAKTQGPSEVWEVKLVDSHGPAPAPQHITHEIASHAAIINVSLRPKGQIKKIPPDPP